MILDQTSFAILNNYMHLPCVGYQTSNQQPVPTEVLLQHETIGPLLRGKEPGCYANYEAIEQKLKILEPHMKVSLCGPDLMKFFANLRQLREAWLTAATEYESLKDLNFINEFSHWGRLLEPDERGALTDLGPITILRDKKHALSKQLKSIKASREFARYVHILEMSVKKHKIHLRRQAQAAKMKKIKAVQSPPMIKISRKPKQTMPVQAEKEPTMIKISRKPKQAMPVQVEKEPPMMIKISRKPKQVMPVQVEKEPTMIKISRKPKQTMPVQVEKEPPMIKISRKPKQTMPVQVEKEPPMIKISRKASDSGMKKHGPAAPAVNPHFDPFMPDFLQFKDIVAPVPAANAVPAASTTLATNAVPIDNAVPVANAVPAANGYPAANAYPVANAYSVANASPTLCAAAVTAADALPDVFATAWAGAGDFAAAPATDTMPDVFGTAWAGAGDFAAVETGADVMADAGGDFDEEFWKAMVELDGFE
jgi:hypothetical protein